MAHVASMLDGESQGFTEPARMQQLHERVQVVFGIGGWFFRLRVNQVMQDSALSAMDSDGDYDTGSFMKAAGMKRPHSSLQSQTSSSSSSSTSSSGTPSRPPSLKGSPRRSRNKGKSKGKKGRKTTAKTPAKKKTSPKKSKAQAQIDAVNSVVVGSLEPFQWAARICNSAKESGAKCSFQKIDLVTEFTGTTCAEAAVESLVNNMDSCKPELNVCYMADIKASCRRVEMSTRPELTHLLSSLESMVLY